MKTFDTNKNTKQQTKAASGHLKNSSKVGKHAIALEDNRSQTVAQKKENKTGLPNTLKSGIENLSGIDMSDTKVHYNSSKPSQLNAHAYAQGTDIHLATGQEKHLPHEAWHVVQQKQGRVKPIFQMKEKVNINDDKGLEKEADVMGNKASQLISTPNRNNTRKPFLLKQSFFKKAIVQRALKTKEDIFIEQARIIIAKQLFKNNNFLNLKLNGYPVKQKRTTQTNYVNEIISSGRLNFITLKVLQQRNQLNEVIKMVSDHNADWASYKTEISGASNEKGKAVGLVGSTNNGKREKSVISWEPVNSHNGEGTKMTAIVLGPDHKLGTPPSDKVKAAPDELTEYTGYKYIAGHLLNDHLGGPGSDPRNITAIPTDVNSEQSTKVENEVKRRVNKEGEIVYYSVSVNYTEDKAVSAYENLKIRYYASNISSRFGTYKVDSQFKGWEDLKDIKVHSLPINPPSMIKKQNKGKETGYSVKSKDEYATGDKRTPQQVDSQPETHEESLKMNLNPHTDIILGDTKQMSLEFISYALSSIQINELVGQINSLKGISERQVSDYKKRLKDAYETIEKLQVELHKIKEELLSETERDLDQERHWKELYNQMEYDKKELANTNKILQQKLAARTEQYRDSKEEIGYLRGKYGEEEGEDDLSETSQARRSQGYQRGRKERKIRLQQEEREKSPVRVIKRSRETQPPPNRVPAAVRSVPKVESDEKRQKDEKNKIL